VFPYFFNFDFKQEIMGRTKHLHRCDMNQKETGRETSRLSSDRIQNDECKILLLLGVLVAAETCLSNRCVAPNGKINLTEPLPSNDRRDTHTYRLMEGIYAVRHSGGVYTFTDGWDQLRSAISALHHQNFNPA
jgi:hypothetical protein